MNYVCIVRPIAELWPLFAVTNAIVAPAFSVPFSPFPYLGKR